MVLPFAVSKHGAGTGSDRLTITGEIDQDVSEGLATLIVNAVEQDGVTEVVVDLRHVTFLAAAGVRALLAGAAAAAARGCGYRVVNAHGLVYDVLRITNLLDILDVCREPGRTPGARHRDRSFTDRVSG